MASIVRGQPNTTSKVNWFITVGGVLNDAYEVGFRILDITSGLPGTQIFPSTPGEYEDVTSAPGHFGVGRYYAYDSESTAPWTPSLGASLGTHRIIWRWKIDATRPYQSGQEDFEVLAEGGVAPVDTYITVQDIRNAGLTDTTIFPDDDVLAAIELWQQFIDRATRQWFLPKALVIKFDGNDSDAIHFGVPIISIDYLKINDQETLLDETCFKVYSAQRYPDDRRNPCIKLRNEYDLDIFTAPIIGRRLHFRKGRQNQEVKGIFGFTEEDGSVPRLIKRALSKLVIEKLTNPLYHDPSSPAPTPASPLTGNLLEEWSDGHKQKWGAAGGELKPRSPGMTGITNDQEILDIIRLYKAPIGIATPSHPSHY